MKFLVTFKDPDGPSDCINEAAVEEAKSVAKFDDLDEDEQDSLVESRKEKLNELCRTWFEYGEYVTIEIDTEAKTATVVPET